MTAPRVISIDFESWSIEDRPAYPPHPVGVSIKWPGQASRYYAWGHASDNNCTEADGKAALEAALNSDYHLLFHGGKFDIEVAIKWLGLNPRDSRLAWDRMHDTSFLAFLCDPHAMSHGLKELAERHLNWAPDEKDEVAAWVWEKRADIEFSTKRRVTRTTRSNSMGKYPVAGNAMEFIPYVPGSLAGKYACGDTDRTVALFEMMYAYVEQNGMLEAYDRERELLPILMENERAGIRVDLDLLRHDTGVYQQAIAFVEAALRERLNAPGLNFDNDQEYAEALINADIVPEELFQRTPKTGKFKVGKDALTPELFTDPFVASAMGYRNRLKTALTMFMEPWLRQAELRNGVVSTNWNQTRGGDGGTRTGRPSTSNPNFLNISKSFEGRPDGYVHPDFLGVPPLPLVRRYMLPDEGEYWLHRDFSGQELRVFAHFEDGALLAAYRENAALDPHSWVRDKMQQVIPSLIPDPSWAQDRTDKWNSALRTKVKVTNFQSIYGGGVGAISRGLKISEQEAKEFKRFHDAALPGRKELNDRVLALVRTGQPIRTWGGRIYYPEEPKFVDGRFMSFEYKLINYLVQGSAADITKQAIIDWHNHPDRRARFLVTVYDEINVSAPIGLWKPQMKLLRNIMCADRLKCPMLSDGKYGPRWGELEKYE